MCSNFHTKDVYNNKDNNDDDNDDDNDFAHNDDHLIPADNAKILIAKKCRCGKVPFICLQKKNIFCSTCFYDYCTHKFRATLGKSKLVKYNHSIMIAFSGGSSSTAMLDLIMNGLYHKQFHGKFLLSPFILYIHELDYQNEEEVANDHFKQICDIMLKTKLKSFISSLEMIYFDGPKYQLLTPKTQFPLTSKSCYKKFETNLSKIESLSAKLEWIKILRIRLLEEIAIHENADFIFTGENSSKLATDLITNVTQGKGSQINYENSFLDKRYSIPILRPMREFIKKEIVFWNLLRKNEWIERLNLNSKMDKKSSLSKLTESFIVNLEKDYPSTVYTIFKIGDKVESSYLNGQKCTFCKSPIEILKDNWSALHALHFSNQLLKNFKTNKLTKDECKLCFGCKTILQDSKLSVDDFNYHITSKAQSSTNF